MTREEAEQLLPIIKAFSEGKEIEGLYKGTKSPWFKIKDMDFNEGIIFRIKPESKYRSFANAEECWQEIQKHQPFGWVKDTEANEYLNVYCISNSASSIDLFCRMFKRCIFIDGSPCGVKVEE